MTRNEFAAEALVHLDVLCAFCRRLEGQSDGDDLLQATYERAFERWRSLRGRDGCRAWLFRIARNLHIDRMRARRARPELQLLLGDKAFDPPWATAESIQRVDRDVLERALRTLPASQHEAVVLCDVWEFTYPEIATIVEAPIGTVRSRIARGRARLAALLADPADRVRAGEVAS